MINSTIALCAGYNTQKMLHIASGAGHDYELRRGLKSDDRGRQTSSRDERDFWLSSVG